MASQDASSMNSQLMINAISPNERIENGQCDGVHDRFDRRVDQRKEQRERADAENGWFANGVHAGKQCDHDPGRNGQNQPT